MKIGNTEIGDGCRTYIVGEIGINHSGDIEIAKELMLEAAAAGFDAVKFQKREPEECVPVSERDKMRETPWGYISYMEYRERVEFAAVEYDEIYVLAKELGIAWFASVWDQPSVDFMEQYDPIAYKVPSACVTDLNLLRKLRDTGQPIILSTGMSTMNQIIEAVGILSNRSFTRTFTPTNQPNLLSLLHCTSTYPCPLDELNLRMIDTYRHMGALNGILIGYSGHEVSLTPSIAAVVLGADIVERHITMDRSSWGSDQGASIEPRGMELLVSRIRRVEAALGDGVKQVYPSELSSIEKLRRVK